MSVTKNDLAECLKAILADWDESMHGDIEKFKTTTVGKDEYNYWSPAQSLVRSEVINRARLLLQKLKNKS